MKTWNIPDIECFRDFINICNDSNDLLTLKYGKYIKRVGDESLFVIVPDTDNDITDYWNQITHQSQLLNYRITIKAFDY